MSKIDYPLEKIKGVVFDVDGVLSPSTVPMSDDGIPCRMVNIKDGYALQHAIKAGLKIAIITGANTDSICYRYVALGIHDVFLKASHKLPILEKWMTENHLNPDQVAYMGDDIPDLTCLRTVGLPTCPADAAPEVKACSRYITTAAGGYGAARELLEQILRAQGKWMNDAEAFGW